MINVKDNVWIPDEGFKYITNGDVYASEIQIADNQQIADWHDTNDEPSPIPEEEATAEDYEAAPYLEN